MLIYLFTYLETNLSIVAKVSLEFIILLPHCVHLFLDIKLILLSWVKFHLILLHNPSLICWIGGFVCVCVWREREWRAHVSSAHYILSSAPSTRAHWQQMAPAVGVIFFWLMSNLKWKKTNMAQKLNVHASWAPKAHVSRAKPRPYSSPLVTPFLWLRRNKKIQ